MNADNTIGMTSGIISPDSQPLTGSQSLTGKNARDMENNFLTLLVAQLKNQDPTNPMDNSQLTSQLAQISTVSGVEKLNQTLGKISGQINESQTVQAMALIGRGVMVPGTKILVGKNVATDYGFELDQPAKQVTATITDGSGRVINSFNLGPQLAGVQVFNWNGKQLDGSDTPEGSYHLTVTAMNDDSKPLTVQPLNYAKVSGLIRDQGNNLLDLGTFGTAPLGSVRKVL